MLSSESVRLSGVYEVKATDDDQGSTAVSDQNVEQESVG